MHGKMLLACQDRIVRVQTIFLQKRLPVGDLNIQQGVAHTEEGKSHNCREEVERTEGDAYHILLSPEPLGHHCFEPER